MTATLERPAPDQHMTDLEKENRHLKLAMIMLAVVALVLGLWGVYQATTGDESPPVPDGIDTLIDDWGSALEQGDDSVLELYLPSGYHLYGDMRFKGEDLVDHLAGNSGFSSEWITPTYVTADEGDGTYVVVRGIRNTEVATGASWASAFAFEIETVAGGELKIAHTAFIYRRD